MACMRTGSLRLSPKTFLKVVERLKRGQFISGLYPEMKVISPMFCVAWILKGLIN